jgi:hypothetical protein
MNGPLVEEVSLWYSELYVEILVSYVYNVFGVRCISILRVRTDVRCSATFRVPAVWVAFTNNRCTRNDENLARRDHVFEKKFLWYNSYGLTDKTNEKLLQVTAAWIRRDNAEEL